MKISESYSELSRLISDKSGKQINLSYGGSSRTLTVKLLGVPLYVRVEKIEAQSVVVSHQIGRDCSVTSPENNIDPMPSDLKLFGGLLKSRAQSVGVQAVNGLLKRYVNNPAITINGDKTITIGLDKIPQICGFVEKGELKDITFDEDGTSINFYVKPT